MKIHQLYYKYKPFGLIKSLSCSKLCFKSSCSDINYPNAHVAISICLSNTQPPQPPPCYMYLSVYLIPSPTNNLLTNTARQCL